MVVSRFSYGLYLMQYTIFNYNIGTVRGTEQFQLFGSMVSFHFSILKAIISIKIQTFQANFGEYFWIIGSALVLTVFVEQPFGNIKKLIFNNKKKVVSVPAPPPPTPVEVTEKTSLYDENMNDISDYNQKPNGISNGNGIHHNGSAKKVD